MELQQLEKRIGALENENEALKKEYGLTAKHPFSFYKEKRREEFKRFIGVFIDMAKNPTLTV